MIATLISQDPEVRHGFSLAWQLIRNRDPALVYATEQTLLVGCKSTGLAAVFALPLGCALGLGNFRGRRALLALSNGLARVPPVVIGVIVLLLFTYSSPFGGGPFAALGGHTSADPKSSGSNSYPTPVGVLDQGLIAFPVILALTATAVQRTSSGLLDQARAYGARGWKLSLLAVRETRAAVMAGIVVAMGLTMSTVGAIVVSGNAGVAGYMLPAQALGYFKLGDSQYTPQGTLLPGKPYAPDTIPLGVADCLVMMGLFLLVAAGLTFLQQSRTSWIAGRQS